MRLPLPAVAVVAALALAAGCGGGDAEPVGFTVADAVPASAAAYVSLRTDLDDEQWQRVDSLVARFSEGEGGVQAMLGRALAGEGVDYDRDVEPALGRSVELVWLDFDSAPAQDGDAVGKGENVVALTQPDDEDKLSALAAKSDEGLVVGEIDEWSAVARSQELLDRFEAELAKGKLADDAGFREVSSDLPGDALVTVYGDGDRARAAFSSLAGRGAALSGSPGLGEIERGAAALEAVDEGFRLTAHVQRAGEATEAQGSSLLAEVPSGAFVAIDLGGRGDDARSGLEGLERQAGVPIAKLAALLEGGAVFYALPAPIIPELTLLTAPPDAAQAKADLDEALAATPILGGAERRQTQIGGAEATVVDLGRLSIVYAAVGERLVLSTLPGAIRAVEEGGDKLVDDDRYRSALDAAGIGEDETVLAYADLQQALKLVEGLSMMGGGGPSADAAKGLEALRSLVVASSEDGDRATFRLFLGVE